MPHSNLCHCFYLVGLNDSDFLKNSFDFLQVGGSMGLFFFFLKLQ